MLVEDGMATGYAEEGREPVMVVDGLDAAKWAVLEVGGGGDGGVWEEASGEGFAGDVGFNACGVGSGRAIVHQAVEVGEEVGGGAKDLVVVLLGVVDVADDLGVGRW